MSNEKKQIKQAGPILGVCTVVILIVGCLLATDPVKALNSTSPVPTPTGLATSEPTPGSVILSINGPSFVSVGETVHLSVEARGVSGQGLYGAQLAINFDPILLSVSNMQVNSDFSYILQSSADNALGQINLVATRQGPAAGLIGDVTLFSFDASALSGDVALLGFENVEMGDPQAQPFTFTSEDFTLFIDNEVPATPVDESPTPTEQPTLTPTPTYEPTWQPTDEPSQPTDEPTLIPIPTYDPSTDQPTDEPPQPTDEPTLIPIPTYDPSADQPTDEPSQPTDEPTLIPIPTYDSSADQPTATSTDQPTAQLTDQPTATPSPTGQASTSPTGESTPQPLDQPTFSSTGEPISQLTAEPGHTVVLGQIVLAGRVNDDWSEGTITLDDTGQNVTSDVNGHFTISDVAAGDHASITADAPGYLPAVCKTVTVSPPETALATINLLSGDINNDDTIDIADATAIGVNFGQTGPDLPPDINRNESADIFDLILVSVNFGQGPQAWSCLTPSVSLLGVE